MEITPFHQRLTPNHKCHFKHQDKLPSKVTFAILNRQSHYLNFKSLKNSNLYEKNKSFGRTDKDHESPFSFQHRPKKRSFTSRGPWPKPRETATLARNQKTMLTGAGTEKLSSQRKRER